MRINLKHSANWEDFENLCFHLWRSIWGDINAHPNGRRGQRQNGVDIYGKTPFNASYTGIQCKGKNENYGKQLTNEEIDKECDEAKKFTPKLGTFIMATTSPRDVEIQEHCRELSNNQKYEFEVDTWSWDDIEEEVQSRPEIMKKFYPEIETSELINVIKLSRITTSNRLHAFFSRPGLLDFLNGMTFDILDNIAYELAINAFEHGKATYFNVCIEGRKIVFKEDGKKFNPLTLLSNKAQRGGSMTLKFANDIFDFNYSYEDANILELLYKGNGDYDGKEESYSICLNVMDVFGRSQIKEIAYKEIAKIPGDAKNIVIDIWGKTNPAISIMLTFFETLQQLIKTDQSVHIYIPNGLYYYKNLVKEFKDDPRFKLIEKK